MGGGKALVSRCSINTVALHAVTAFGQSKNPPVLQTLLPAHLQHHKELLLTPGGGGGRWRERGREESSEQRLQQIIPNNPV